MSGRQRVACQGANRFKSCVTRNFSCKHSGRVCLSHKSDTTCYLDILRRILSFYVYQVPDSCFAIVKKAGFKINKKKGVTVNMNKEGLSHGCISCSIAICSLNSSLSQLDPCPTLGFVPGGTFVRSSLDGGLLSSDEHLADELVAGLGESVPATT